MTTTATATHVHSAAATQTTPFVGCVAGPECCAHSHGNVAITATCSCGCRRASNHNQGYAEYGPWARFIPGREPAPRFVVRRVGDGWMGQYDKWEVVEVATGAVRSTHHARSHAEVSAELANR